MKYFSLDIETTGLDENEHQIIELGGVVDDLEDPKPIDELPEFHCYVTHDTYNVSEYCLGLHSDTGIFKKLQKRPDDANFVPVEDAAYEMGRFLYQHFVPRAKQESWYLLNSRKKAYMVKEHLPVRVIAAGKNFGAFDLRFIKQLPNLDKFVRFHHRILDPGSMYTRPDDSQIPMLKECLERAGFDDDVPHHAVEDAKLVVKLIRRHYNLPV